ncbi:MAG TPA: hypothetical protein VHA82_08495 [Ramlibacter sp.]|uniref:hypothetical protein n=1 Tax=Ramlibacter sp. TaxID=1917967 RepID=UPI002C9EA6AE|nr:hypothetical protein [Ramlibacter sp.]HVZ43835.1 hypothetical protein [Ramlibacter sp.]
MQYQVQMSTRMLAIAGLCVFLLCVLLFLLGIELGKRFAETDVAAPYAVPMAAPTAPAAPAVPTAPAAPTFAAPSVTAPSVTAPSVTAPSVAGPSVSAPAVSKP